MRRGTGGRAGDSCFGGEGASVLRSLSSVSSIGVRG
jgi:hypothetical protein